MGFFGYIVNFFWLLLFCYVDTIEGNINKTTNFTRKAEVQLRKASEYQRNYRSKVCWLIIIVVFVVAIIMLVLLFGGAAAAKLNGVSA